MQRRRRKGAHGSSWALAMLMLAGATVGMAASVNQHDVPEAARQAYEVSDYRKAVLELQAAAAREPQNGDIQLLLTKCFLELQDHDAAIRSAEQAVAIDPNNSVYHEWLGKAYGEKASHASMFSALGLAKKTHKEFETAVQLDDRNYSARQALIEFDCSAPSMVGGGEEKAKPEIEKLQGMDASEWHYAAGNCWRQKKEYAAADAEFQLALESHPKSAELIYDIGDYALKRSEAQRLLDVAEIGEKTAPTDPRSKFYRATGLILQNEKQEQCEAMLREYLRRAPRRSGYPRYAVAHEWLGREYENRGDQEAAAKEYQAALQVDPKDKNAHDALKRLGKN
jgi:tetratricopeptide (TPR) repeat protein